MTGIAREPDRRPLTDRHEEERLHPGSEPDRVPPPPKRPGRRNKAALPGSQNSDLRGARRDRRPRGAST
jgi:hypothetical protein